MGRGLTVVAATVALDVMVGGIVLREEPVEGEVTKLVLVNQNPAVAVVRGAVVNKIAISKKAGGGVRTRVGCVKAMPTAGQPALRLVVSVNKLISAELRETVVTARVVILTLGVRVPLLAVPEFK